MENTTTAKTNTNTNTNTNSNCKKEEITDCIALKKTYLECLNNFLLESNADCCTETFKSYTNCNLTEAHLNKYSK